MMLSAGDGSRSWRVGRAASAGFGILASPSFWPTLVASVPSMLSRCETIRSRMTAVFTLLSSNVSAAAMWFCSVGVWLMKNCLAWL